MFKLNGYPNYYFNNILHKFLNPTINDNLNSRTCSKIKPENRLPFHHVDFENTLRLRPVCFAYRKKSNLFF